MTTTAPDRLDSFNPFTGARLGAVAADGAGGRAGGGRRRRPGPAVLGPADAARPCAYLERAAQVLIDESDEIRDLIVAEQGKPRNEAFSMEVLPTIDALQLDRAARASGSSPTSRSRCRSCSSRPSSSAFTYEPLGVIAVISPWNYPWSIPFGEVALALMAGNGVVLKPASLTPLIGERIAAGVRARGRARGPDPRACTGPAPVRRWSSPSVAKVFFTGSVETGRGVGEECARQLKGSVLELGGKDPMIVLPDANLDHAVAGALWGGFANAGQTCSGIERVYVMREVADRFIAGVVAGARELRVGDPMGWDTEIGPMVSREQFELVARARRRRRRRRAPAGVRRAASRTRPSGSPASSTPRRCSPASPTRCGSCARRSSARCSRSSSSTPRTRRWRWPTTRDFGLGASVWTSDRSKGERIARELEAGMVWINDHMFSHGACQCSWGGVKESGPGPHPLQVRPVRVRQRQAAGVGALGDPQRLVAPIRRDARPALCARPRRSSTGARRSGRPPCGRSRAAAEAGLPSGP